MDSQAVATGTLSAVQDGTATLILRGIELTKGQHTLTVKWSGTGAVEKLCMLRSAEVTEITKDYAAADDGCRYTDGGWQIAGGTLTMPGSGGFGKRLYGSPNMGDYTVEVTVTPKGAPNCGLLVRATNPGSPNFLGTSASREDAMTATDWIMGYFVGLSSDGVIIGKQSYSYREVARAAGDFGSNTAYTLKVECEGATLRVFVDGKLYLEYTDPEPFTRGMAGVRTHNCGADFDGLTVKAVD